MMASCSNVVGSGGPGFSEVDDGGGVDVLLVDPRIDGGAASAVTCDASGCGARVGGISVHGFADRVEAERVVAVLAALPALLTATAAFDVTRDPVDQTGCPNPTRTPLDQVPSHCGYASVDTVGSRLVLGLRDACLVTFPERLDHVLVTFLARDWYLAHDDEVLAKRQEPGWNLGCYACPGDPAEPCAALDRSNALVQLMRDFTSSVAALLLEVRAWGNVGVRWVESDGDACTPGARLDWLSSRVVEGSPQELVTRALDVQALCGPEATTVGYRLSTTSGIATVKLASIGISGETIFYYLDGAQASANSQPRSNGMTDGLERVVAWSDRDFDLVFIDCGE